ncbi:GspS/AspS pilotin family protein [Vibrio maerlii]|uniref:GspS/AspS pilotin family protein n=1 Tax=Vibrio maerlii TaxID=2231648 RepID=UPI000E3E4DAD|nr:GspS/AspS pilotin family protein [Vibrio maerlii]
MHKIIIGLFATAIISGCASNEREQQKQLEALANNRATVLSTGLPLEEGPLSIMSARAKGTSIELMMIYNQEAPGAMPVQQVYNKTLSDYCSNQEIRSNLDLGLSYALKMRNHRGQLLVDALITAQSCQ